MTNTFRVTHTFDSDHCPFRRFIPVCQGTGRPQGYECNLMEGAPCTGRNCPALTPGGDTLDLGVPCAECGATDGWICECGFTPAKAITSPEKTAALLDFYYAVKQANVSTDGLGVFDWKVVAALDELERRLEEISEGGGAPFHLASNDPLFEKAVEDAKCNCDQHQRGWSTGGWQCPVHGAQF